MADPKQYAAMLDEDALRKFNSIEAQGQPFYKTGLPMEGRSLLFPFKDSMPGSVFNERSIALPGLLAGALNYFSAPERARTGSDPNFNPGVEAANMALNTFGGGIATGKALKAPTGQGGTDLAMNAWHGTPHNIEGKFDLAKVGTGEGAQAYGHGIYFAQNPNVAKEYQKRLASDRGFSFDGKSGLTRQEVQDLVNAKYGSGYLDGVIRPSGVADSFIDDMVTGITRPEGAYPKQYKTGSERAKIYDELRGKISHAEPGNLYKVDIPDEQIPMMLDWDKPFNQQSQAVKDGLAKLGITADEKAYKSYLDDLEAQLMGGEGKGVKDVPMPLGQDIYRKLTAKFGSDAAASRELNKVGIPGIRYLDEGSRAQGGGTSNFVSFQPETVKILEKNDKPVTRKDLLKQEFDKLEK